MHSYIDQLNEDLPRSSIWEYLSYDEQGLLWLDDICVMDLVERYQAPLEINYLPLIQKKGDAFKKIAYDVAAAIHYQGGFEFLYATKANMRAEYLIEATKSHWNIETTSHQDLEHLKFLFKNNLIDKNILIVCNGHKRFKNTTNQQQELKTQNIQFEGELLCSTSDRVNLYADTISQLHNQGYNILPILDTEEIEYFSQQKYTKKMSVGVRMKFGKVHTSEELDSLAIRHGMDWEELSAVAEIIEQTPHLELKMFHAMAGISVHKLPEESVCQSLLFAVDYYFKLKKLHPSLTHFNIGGGIPATNSGFNYNLFLETFLSGVKEKAAQHGLDMPCITFELGTYLTDETGFYVYKVAQKKQNSKSSDKKWAIIDGGLMADMPDALFVDKAFSVLAVNQSNNLPEKYIVGDVSCDTDGRYPKKDSNPDYVYLPETDQQLFILVAGVGAYQKILTGIGGAHHCGILEPKQLVIKTQGDNKIVSLSTQQTSETYKALLGYV